MKPPFVMVLALALAALLSAGPRSQSAQLRDGSSVPSPESEFGKAVGADHFLANYTQLCSYWQKLAQSSDRIRLERIGTTSYGQAMWTAIVTSPANHAKLEVYRLLNERLARAKDTDPRTADRLIQEGKPVVWIDAGMHANESVAAQNIIELSYRLCSRDDVETRRILDEVICLITPANPDGMEMIANAYMATGTVGGLPVLYQRYIGHDNNRDYYMLNMPESRAIANMLYRRWYPQIVYNHHQTAPRGTVIFTPPFRDPFNYNFDPLIVRGIEIVAAHMNWRFTREDKAGVISRTGATYSTWWNGGLRTTAYFHNMIGILTEVFGHPTPSKIVQGKDRRLPYGDYPLPIATQAKWHARQTIEYLQTANYAILDYASRYGDELQQDMWRIGRRAIEDGSRDTWKPTPAMVAKMANDNDDAPFKDASTRTPRAYVIPRDQTDFAAAVRFVEALRDCGIEVQRARRAFEHDGRSYPSGSFVVRCDQAFRAHVLDMFEPQWHPDDVAATGEPIRPYDSAGWTLALQMGVDFTRVFDEVQGPFDEVGDTIDVLAGRVDAAERGWLLALGNANAYRAIHRLQAAAIQLYMGVAQMDDLTSPALENMVWIPKSEASSSLVAQLAADLGLDFVGCDTRPNFEPGTLRRLERCRVGLFDVFGGHMPTGWTQWVLEQFGFAVELVRGDRVIAGDLGKDFDVLIFMTGLPSFSDRPRERPARVDREALTKLQAALPPFEDWSHIAAWKTVLTRDNAASALRDFVAGGGSILGVQESAEALVKLFDLPFRSGIRVDTKGVGGQEQQRAANRSEFFIPGSLIRVRYDGATLLGCDPDDGRPEPLVMFRRSPVFEAVTRDDTTAEPSEHSRRLGAVMTPMLYADTDQLASGWAIGQQELAGKVAAIQAEYGDGQVFVFGPDMLYRGQSWSSFHPVFRAILSARSRKVAAVD